LQSHYILQNEKEETRKIRGERRRNGGRRRRREKEGERGRRREKEGEGGRRREKEGEGGRRRREKEGRRRDKGTSILALYFLGQGHIREKGQDGFGFESPLPLKFSYFFCACPTIHHGHVDVLMVGE
jgi:hypothetical protein